MATSSPLPTARHRRSTPQLNLPKGSKTFPNGSQTQNLPRFHPLLFSTWCPPQVLVGRKCFPKAKGLPDPPAGASAASLSPGRPLAPASFPQRPPSPPPATPPRTSIIPDPAAGAASLPATFPRCAQSPGPPPSRKYPFILSRAPRPAPPAINRPPASFRQRQHLSTPPTFHLSSYPPPLPRPGTAWPPPAAGLRDFKSRSFSGPAAASQSPDPAFNCLDPAVSRPASPFSPKSPCSLPDRLLPMLHEVRPGPLFP